MKLQPLKNFKYKYLFGDIISKGDGVSNSHTHDDVLLPIPFAMEHYCEVMDLVLAQENIALTKKRKKAYEMNMHFQDTWAIELLWAISFGFKWQGCLSSVQDMFLN
jgi:hypothetical protein